MFAQTCLLYVLDTFAPYPQRVWPQYDTVRHNCTKILASNSGAK